MTKLRHAALGVGALDDPFVHTGTCASLLADSALAVYKTREHMPRESLWCSGLGLVEAAMAVLGLQSNLEHGVVGEYWRWLCHGYTVWRRG
jgi:hypothetical protein